MRSFKAKLVAFGLVASLGLAGCGGSGSGGSGNSDGGDGAIPKPDVKCDVPEMNIDGNKLDTSKVEGEIRFMTQNLKNDFSEFFEKQIAQFEKENPGTKVIWEDKPGGPDFDKNMAADAVECQMADVINVPDQTILALSKANLLMNLDVKAPGIGDKFMENLWNATAVGANGAHTGLPWYTFPNITTYNKDVFKRSGLDENTVPATMKDMFDMARKVAEAGNGDYGLYGNANWYLAPQWAALGVKFMNDDKSEFVFAQDPLALDWVTNMAELYKMGAIPKDSLTGEPDANKAYFEGNLAIGTPNPSFLRAVKRNNPNVYASTGVGKFPRNEGVTPAIGGQYIAVSAATKNAPLAMKFAEFLTSDEQELAWARDGGAIIFPPAKKALEELLANPPKFVDDEIFSAAYKVAAESLEENRSEPALLYIQGSIQQELVNNINAGVRGEVSPQEALDKAQDAMNRLLKQLNN